MAAFTVVPERSRVWIEGRSSVHGLRAEADGLTGHVELTFGADGAVDLSAGTAGMVSFAVDRLSTGHRLEDRELQNRLDARRHPTIEGVLDRVASTDDGSGYRVDGTIACRGVSRPHQGRMTIRLLDQRTVELCGAAPIDVRQFGIQAPRVLMLKVDPEVTVRVEIVAETGP